MEGKEVYISWSGGKDSTATIILCHELGLRVDGIVMSEVMFDRRRGISGEDPEHIKWVHEVAIPRVENEFGYRVEVLRAEKDYLDLFNHVITRSKHPERIGKKNGFAIPGMCTANRDLKMRPLNDWRKAHKGAIEYVGICRDEPIRFERLARKENKYSLLYDFGMTQSEAKGLCASYGLLSPSYENGVRGGCWFCPNNARNLKGLRATHPELIEELRRMSKDPELTTKIFAHGRTLEEWLK